MRGVCESKQLAKEYLCESHLQSCEDRGWAPDLHLSFSCSDS